MATFIIKKHKKKTKEFEWVIVISSEKNLHAFNKSIFCGVTDIMSLFKFSLHFAKQVRCKLTYHSSYVFGKFWQVVAK